MAISYSMVRFYFAASAAICWMLRPVVLILLLRAWLRKISTVEGVKPSRIEKTIGMNPGGRRGGRLSTGVSIHPKRKL